MENTKAYVVSKKVLLHSFFECPVAVFFNKQEADFYAWQGNEDNSPSRFSWVSYVSYEVEEVEVKSADLTQRSYKKFKAEKLKELSEKIENAKAHSKGDLVEVTKLEAEMQTYL